MALPITITDAGRAEIINAQNTGTGPVTITEIGFGTGQYTPAKTRTALQAQVKRVSSIAGQAVAADTIHVMALDESSAAYNVGEFGLFSDKGTLIAVYSQPAASGWIIQKAGPSTLLLATDIILESLNATSITFGDISFINPPATTTVQGVVELATPEETQTGTDASRAVTPAGLKSLTGSTTRAGLVRLNDTLTSTSTSQALTAAQGKKLQDEKLDKTRVQTSKTDTTADALLVVGGFGIGAQGAAAPSDDLDLVAASGIYNINTGTLNKPAVSSGSTCLHMRYGDGYAEQLVLSRTSDKMFFRRCNAGVWSSWQELWHSGNLQKQADVADTTTGALLTVGAFGLGGAALIGTSADLNSYTTGGKFITPNSGLTNIPAGWSASVRYHLEVIGGASNRSQILMTTGAALGSTLQIAVRWHNGTGWSAWSELFHSGNVTAFAKGLLDDASAAEAQATLDLVKQATWDDATAGRLMTVGAFGLGTGQTSAETDLNNLTTPGFYGTLASGVSNLPPGFSGGRTVVQFMGTTTYGVQLAWEVASATMTQSLSSWRRIRGGTWGPWVAILNSSNVQTGPMDTTANVLMTVGAFGLGGQGVEVPGDNCNLITVNGTYRMSSATANAWPSKLSGDVLIHAAYASAFALQIGGHRAGKAFIRYNYSGTWTSWVELLNETHRQTNDKDVTSGALLTVGAFGLGPSGAALPNNDCNLAPASGVYGLNSGALNSPLGGSGHSLLHVGYNSDNASQLLFERGRSTIYWRAKSAGTWSAWTSLYHAGNLSPVETSRIITAGVGMQGGGSLAENRTISLGTPGTITKSSTNSVSSNSHTHELTLPAASTTEAGIVQLIDSLDSVSTSAALTAAQGKKLQDEKAPAARNIVAGNGLSGGGTLAADRTLTLGTPGTLSGSSTNAVTTSSHTHAISAATDALRGVIELATAAEVAAGDATRAVTGATLIAGMLGLGSMGGSGYITIPYRDSAGVKREFIFQWTTTGTVASPQTLAEVIWPVAYPNACLGVHAQDHGTDLNQVKSWKTYSSSKTGAQMFYANDIGNNQGNAYVYSWGY